MHAAVHERKAHSPDSASLKTKSLAIPYHLDESNYQYVLIKASGYYRYSASWDEVIFLVFASSFKKSFYFISHLAISKSCTHAHIILDPGYHHGVSDDGGRGTVIALMQV